tara:strand:- start:1932 stop:2261 length:330 start_codon:yes stop_codon:yes gene_type:complete
MDTIDETPRTSPHPVIWIYTKPACIQVNGTYKALNKWGLPYNRIDMSINKDARDFTMTLGYLQAPVVYVTWVSPPHLCAVDAEIEHWSGFRPDRVTAIANKAGLIPLTA